MNSLNLSKLILRGFFGLSAGFTLVSCSGGGGSLTGSSTGGGGSALSVSVSSVYPTSAGNSGTAIVDGSDRTHIKGRSVSVSGSCSRGVESVQVVENSSLFSSETATCDVSGAFVWTKQFSAGAEQDYSVTFRAVSASGVPETSGAVTKLIRVDDLSPGAPTIVAPSGSGSYTQTSGATVTVSGTVPSGVTRITGPSGADSETGSGGLTLTGTNFSMVITLTQGSPVAYAFTAYDLAGNNSASTSITISYIPSINLAFGGAISGGNISGTGGYQAELSSSEVPFFATDASGFSLSLGFNRMVNTGRAQQ